MANYDERPPDSLLIERRQGDDSPLTEAEHRFAELLGRLLAQRWQEEHQS
jgi:hypothetical protein